MGSRVLVLLRHGQYDVTSLGSLTALGRRQASTTARFLADAGTRFDALWSSTLPRAKETADIVGREIAFEPKATRLLKEGMYTKLAGYDTGPEDRREDRERADAAYEKFFRPSRVDRAELLVCHGNLIRFLLCRAIGISYVKWMRLNSHHCGLTRIVVRGSGAVQVVSYNETAHLPAPLVT